MCSPKIFILLFAHIVNKEICHNRPVSCHFNNKSSVADFDEWKINVLCDILPKRVAPCAR